MANELTLRIFFEFLKGGNKRTLDLGTILRDVAGTKADHKSQIVGFAAEEALDLGDIGVGGYLIAVNRDTANFVEIRPNTGLADLIRMEPGDLFIGRIADDAVPYVLADTANVELEYIIVEA